MYKPPINDTNGWFLRLLVPKVEIEPTFLSEHDFKPCLLIVFFLDLEEGTQAL